MAITDLNSLTPCNTTQMRTDEYFLDNSMEQPLDAKCQVFFRNLESHLIAEIERADVVIGCVAWLTSGPILDALAAKKNVSIVIQKEDFLRPDMGVTDRSKWKSWLKRKYSILSCNLERLDFSNVLYYMSQSAPFIQDAIRCVGNLHTEKFPALPKMHNKFLLFCRLETEEEDDTRLFRETSSVVPYTVWTGSFNFTKNSERSLENALLISESKIVDAYYQEFGQIMAISEPLDWFSEWTEPEWKIGS